MRVLDPPLVAHAAGNRSYMETLYMLSGTIARQVMPFVPEMAEDTVMQHAFDMLLDTRAQLELPSQPYNTNSFLGQGTYAVVVQTAKRTALKLIPINFSTLSNQEDAENPTTGGAMILRRSYQGRRACHNNVMSYERMVVLPIEALSQVVSPDIEVLIRQTYGQHHLDAVVAIEMPLSEKGDLHSLACSTAANGMRTLSFSRMCHYSRGMMDGIVFLHDSNLVAGDVKPANTLIMTTHYGSEEAVINDWETAKPVDANGDATGWLSFTPLFMPWTWNKETKHKRRLRQHDDAFSFVVSCFVLLLGYEAVQQFFVNEANSQLQDFLSIVKPCNTLLIMVADAEDEELEDFLPGEDNVQDYSERIAESVFDLVDDRNSNGNYSSADMLLTNSTPTYFYNALKAFHAIFSQQPKLIRFLKMIAIGITEQPDMKELSGRFRDYLVASAEQKDTQLITVCIEGLQMKQQSNGVPAAQTDCLDPYNSVEPPANNNHAAGQLMLPNSPPSQLHASEESLPQGISITQHADGHDNGRCLPEGSVPDADVNNSTALNTFADLSMLQPPTQLTRSGTRNLGLLPGCDNTDNVQTPVIEGCTENGLAAPVEANRTTARVVTDHLIVLQSLQHSSDSQEKSLLLKAGIIEQATAADAQHGMTLSSFDPEADSNVADKAVTIQLTMTAPRTFLPTQCDLQEQDKLPGLTTANKANLNDSHHCLPDSLVESSDNQYTIPVFGGHTLPPQSKPTGSKAPYQSLLCDSESDKKALSHSIGCCMADVLVEPPANQNTDSGVGEHMSLPRSQHTHLLADNLGLMQNHSSEGQVHAFGIQGSNTNILVAQATAATTAVGDATGHTLLPRSQPKQLETRHQGVTCDAAIAKHSATVSLKKDDATITGTDGTGADGSKATCRNTSIKQHTDTKEPGVSNGCKLAIHKALGWGLKLFDRVLSAAAGVQPTRF